MVHNNKVLTVSYGTFSCTLEGFEDSFGTMKAIAEYFRDLASDDRYFGAEPPQPDADMLARIAQREISRRVEAHSDASGIVLRAHDTGAALATAAAVADAEPAPSVEPAPSPEPVAEPVAQAEADVAEPVAEPVAPVVVADVVPVVDDAPVAAEDPVVAEDAVVEAAQADVRDDVAEAEPEVEVEAETVAPDVILDVPAPAVTDEAEAQVEAAAEEDEDALDLSSIMSQQDDADFEDENDTVVAPAFEMIPEPVSTATPAPDSIAAKLQRIRAVVSNTETTEADYDEDQHAEAFLADATQDISSAIAADDDVDVIEDEEDDSIALALAEFELDTAEDVVEDIAEEAAEEPVAQDPEWVEAIAEPTVDATFGDEEIGDDAIGDEDAAGEDTLFAGLSDDDADLETPEGIADLDMKNILSDAAKEERDEASEQDDAAPVRARVVKVKRADLEAAIAHGDLEEIDEDETDGSLSPEEEADLLRELADVEAELHSDDDMEVDADDDGDNMFDTVGDADDDENLFQPEPEDEVRAEDDMTRLMEEAGNKMDEPENAIRRETYTQLRAAVAATQAEKSVTGEIPQLTHDDDYRNDLANVVRPRRPAASGSERPGRPDGDRPAPLKLVAEQRVDDAAGNTQRGPVRPRRVSPADMETALQAENADGQSGFVIFAQEVGATGLSELLEAAAAYMSYVEGRDQFSRPQLMTKVRQVEKGEFNREDGLRSFGQLLRDGKICKTKGGRFTASEHIGFKPAQREAS